jgi:hypothetical protein
MKVTMHKCVTVSGHVAFDAERDVDLPVSPFVGMRVYGAVWALNGCDRSDDPIEEVGCDLPSGKMLCDLRRGDYHLAASGRDDWTEEEVRKHYRDWKLSPEESGPPSVGPERNGA